MEGEFLVLGFGCQETDCMHLLTNPVNDYTGLTVQSKMY